MHYILVALRVQIHRRFLNVFYKIDKLKYMYMIKNIIYIGHFYH